MLTSWQQCLANDPNAYGQFLTIGGFDTGTWGIVYGFNEDSNYGAGSGSGKAGDLTTIFYRDVDDLQRVIRIRSIAVQQNVYFVFGWEVVAMTATADMPICTWKLEINNVVYDFSSAQAAGFIPPVVGRYIGIAHSSIPWNSTTLGEKVPYKFV